MGLLDSVMGAVGQSVSNSLGTAVSGALGDQLGQALGGGNAAGMLQAVTALLERSGGLQGLVQQFQQGGLGEVVASWISTGQNLPVSPEQIGQVLGRDTLGQVAQTLGMDADQAAGPLAQFLPQIVDALTPQGQMPAPDAGMDLASLLPQVLGRLGSAQG